jgi:hypothetical protein
MVISTSALGSRSVVAVGMLASGVLGRKTPDWRIVVNAVLRRIVREATPLTAASVVVASAVMQ